MLHSKYLIHVVDETQGITTQDEDTPVHGQQRHCKFRRLCRRGIPEVFQGGRHCLEYDGHVIEDYWAELHYSRAAGGLVVILKA